MALFKLIWFVCETPKNAEADHGWLQPEWRTVSYVADV